MIVPGLGQVLGLDLARDQLFLEAIAQDDVGRVGDLIGVDPDEAGLDPIVQAQQVVGLPGRALPAEGFARQGRQVADEPGAAADLHLYEQ